MFRARSDVRPRSRVARPPFAGAATLTR